MKKSTAVEEELNYTCVALFGGYVKGSEAFTVAFVDYEGAFFGIEELADCVVAAISSFARKAKLVY